MKMLKRCEICGKDDFTFKFKQWDKNLGFTNKFKLYECRNCGIIFLNPQPSMIDLEKYYSNEKYYSLKGIDNSSIKLKIKLKLYDIFFNKQNKAYLSRLLFSPLNFMSRGTSISSGENLLDIGSGSGQFLYEMKRLGMNVSGIEPGEFKEDESKKYGLNIQKNDIMNSKFEKNFFDLITMNHVLEHLNNPIKVIKKIHSLLNKDGLLIIGVPNSNSIAYKLFGKNWHQLDVPRHLFNYSDKNIKFLLEENGYTIKKIRHNSRPNQFVVSLYFLFGINKRYGLFNRMLELMFLPFTWLLNIICQGDQIEVWCVKS